MGCPDKHLASRFYQLKTGHCLTGRYLAWSTRRPDATCLWCQYKIQTREHLFKNCPQWKSQQRTLWAAVLEESRRLPGPTRGRGRTNIAEVLHRWPMRMRMRPVRPRSGKRGNRRSGLGREGRRRGWGWIGVVEMVSFSVFP